jgi:hypothetical protein
MECWCTGEGKCEIDNRKLSGSSGETQVSLCVNSGCNQCCFDGTFSVIKSDEGETTDPLEDPGVLVQADYLQYNGVVYN